MSPGDDPESESVEDVLTKAESGAPAVGGAVQSRFSAEEIFQRIVASAEDEIASRNRHLFFSGVAAGFAISLTLLGYAVGRAAVAGTDGVTQLAGPLLYPLGFLIIVVGHYQLYTENTLPPIALVLTRLASVPELLRVWGFVVAGNVVGVGVGAFVLANGGILTPAQMTAAEELAAEAVRMPWWSVFFKSIFAGWLVAGLVWLDHASRDTAARILLVYLLIYTIPATGLFHVITATGDALFLFFRTGSGFPTLLWGLVLPTFLGNTVGGVVPVAVLNFAHTEEHVATEDPASENRLSYREWLLGGFIGRSHVRFEDEP